MRSTCLLGVQVAVEKEDWMVLVMDKYNYDIFLKNGCVQRNLCLNCISL